MRYAHALFVATLFAPLAVAQSPLDGSTDARVAAVAYFETRPASAGEARAAMERYRTARMVQDGFVRVELFEQVGRPGHFAVIETWRDQASFDARDSAVQRALLEALEPIRVSGYDERPYKTLVAAPAPDSIDSRSVFVITHVDVAPSPVVAPLLADLAQAGRREAGNLRFDVLQHAMRANHFTVIEHWESSAALAAHVAAAATRAYRDTLQPLTGSPLDERLYVAVAMAGRAGE